MTGPGTVYLLHFSEPIPRDRGDGPRPVGHYLGWASRLTLRLEHHRAGRGARLTAAVAARGIRLELVRTWVGDRNLERRLKNRHGGHPRLCPTCRTAAIGPHRGVVAAHCPGCAKPVCRCGRHLNWVRAGAGHYRHSRRVGCGR